MLIIVFFVFNCFTMILLTHVTAIVVLIPGRIVRMVMTMKMVMMMVVVIPRRRRRKVKTIGNFIILPLIWKTKNWREQDKTIVVLRTSDN